IALFLLWGAAFGRPQSLFHRVLNLRSIVWLGVVSYSFYLYHVTIVYKLMIWATSNQVDFFGHQTLGLILLALAVSAPVAYLSYRYVEFPFLSRKEGRRPRRQVADRAPVAPTVPEPALPERAAT